MASSLIRLDGNSPSDKQHRLAEVVIRVPHRTGEEATGTRGCSERQVMVWRALPPDEPEKEQTESDS